MSRYSLIVARLASLFLLTAFAIGCGGKGIGLAENHPLIATPTLLLRGVVTVRVSAVAAPREAELEAETAVPDATVTYALAGEAASAVRVRTDANGNYQLPIPLGSRGRVTVVKDNRQLSAIVLTGALQGGVVERDVNLESTVVEIALRNQNALSYDVVAMEEAVRIGEAPALLAEVKDAFKNNRVPAPNQQALAEGLEKLQSGEAIAEADCLTGQEWCAVFSQLEAGAQANTYTAHLLLRRDRTDGDNVPTSTATVGAGYLIAQLPSGVTLTTISGGVVLSGSVTVAGGHVSAGNQTSISFLYDEDAGIGEAAKVADLTLTSTRTLTASDRLIVSSQRLLGVLNERRGTATQRSAARIQ